MTVVSPAHAAASYAVEDKTPTHTREEVVQLMKLVEDCAIAENRLYPICEAAAVALGFQDADAVDIDTQRGEVIFKASWRGSYGSEDAKTYTFPIGLLTHPRGAVTGYLKAREKAQAD